MNVVQYIKNKFDPTRPMGRKNYFWTNFIYRAIVMAIIFLFYLIGAWWVIAHHFPHLMLLVVDAPSLLLAFRRARAAKVHFILVYSAGILSVVYYLLSTSIPFVPNLIAGYNVGLSIALLVLENKMEPVAP